MAQDPLGPGLSDSAPHSTLPGHSLRPGFLHPGTGWGARGRPPYSLLYSPHPGSHAEMRPVPVPSWVSWAQLELRLLEAARAPLISLSTGVGSAAFTGPIKHRSWPLQHTACPGKLSPTRPGRTSFFFKEPISQTHKIATHAMGVCALKDNYRATPPPWRLVRREHPPHIPRQQRPWAGLSSQSTGGLLSQEGLKAVL